MLTAVRVSAPQSCRDASEITDFRAAVLKVRIRSGESGANSLFADAHAHEGDQVRRERDLRAGIQRHYRYRPEAGSHSAQNGIENWNGGPAAPAESGKRRNRAEEYNSKDDMEFSRH